MPKKDDAQWDESICVMCGNNQENICIAGKVDTFAGIVIIQCPAFYKGDKTIITINEDGMRELIEEYYPEDLETLTGAKIKGFMQFLFDDVTDWIKDNWEAFNEKAASDGVKRLMESVSDADETARP